MLIPCGQCRRHVRASESACPFCGAEVAPAPARTTLAGRFSRAAIFAGLASCTSSPPPQHVHQPPPPPDDRVVEQPPPPPPPDDTQYAKPPPDDTTSPPPVATGGVTGTVRNHLGQVMPRFRLELDGKPLMTDDKGNFKVENLAPGSHGISMRVSSNPRHNAEYRSVEVKSGTIVRADIQLPAPVVDTGPCCKPYGAPPARRRVV